MTDPNPDIIEKARRALVDEGADSEGGWHSWRCFDRDRYPEPCDCTEEVARAALSAVADDLRAEGAQQALRDEYHTMDELYEYRMLYNALAANAMPDKAVKSWRHSDGEPCFGGGWFVVYLMLPTGHVSNHYRSEHWDLFQIPEAETAPEWDGHTPQVAAQRLYGAVRAAKLREAGR